MNNIRKQSGFTLIELMIVIAILAILLAIAVPAYQNYTIRAQNSECINLAAAAKLAVAETAQSNGETADQITDDAAAGYTFPAAGTQYCSGISIAAGVITAASTAGAGGNFVFSPTQASIDDPIEWECTTTFSNLQQVPAECRGAAGS